MLTSTTWACIRILYKALGSRSFRRANFQRNLSFKVIKEANFKRFRDIFTLLDLWVCGCNSPPPVNNPKCSRYYSNISVCNTDNNLNHRHISAVFKKSVNCQHHKSTIKFKMLACNDTKDIVQSVNFLKFICLSN